MKTEDDKDEKQQSILPSPKQQNYNKKKPSKSPFERAVDREVKARLDRDPAFSYNGVPLAHRPRVGDKRKYAKKSYLKDLVEQDLRDQFDTNGNLIINNQNKMSGHDGQNNNRDSGRHPIGHPNDESESPMQRNVGLILQGNLLAQQSNLAALQLLPQFTGAAMSPGRERTFDINAAARTSGTPSSVNSRSRRPMTQSGTTQVPRYYHGPNPYSVPSTTETRTAGTLESQTPDRSLRINLPVGFNHPQHTTPSSLPQMMSRTGGALYTDTGLHGNSLAFSTDLPTGSARMQPRSPSVRGDEDEFAPAIPIQHHSASSFRPIRSASHGMKRNPPEMLTEDGTQEAPTTRRRPNEDSQRLVLGYNQRATEEDFNDPDRRRMKGILKRASTPGVDVSDQEEDSKPKAPRRRDTGFRYPNNNFDDYLWYPGGEEGDEWGPDHGAGGAWEPENEEDENKPDENASSPY